MSDRLSDVGLFNIKHFHAGGMGRAFTELGMLLGATDILGQVNANVWGVFCSVAYCLSWLYFAVIPDMQGVISQVSTIKLGQETCYVWCRYHPHIPP